MQICFGLVAVLMVGLLLTQGSGWSIAASSSATALPPLDPDRSWEELFGRREDLMVKYLDLDPLGLHGKGRMVLHSLHPLVSMITFEKVVGNPELWLKRMAGSSALANYLLEHQKLGDVTLSKLEVLMTSDGIDFRLERANIADGHLSKVRGRFGLDGRWSIRTGPLWLSRPPLKGMEKMWARPVGYGAVDAFGSKEMCKIVLNEAFALDASAKHMLVNASWNDAVTKGQSGKVQAEVSMELTTFRVNDAFFEQGPRELAKKLLAYADLTPSWGMAFPRITLSGTVTGPEYNVQTLRLSSPSLQIWGTAQGLWSPPPGSITLDLNAKSPGKDAKGFLWSSETPEKK